MNINIDAMSAIIKEQLAAYQTELAIYEEGQVTAIGDGIAHISGLSAAMSNELLQFAGGEVGIALNLETDSIGCVILGDYQNIKEGDLVKRSGRVIDVPVGEALLGRVINPLGLPMDDKGSLISQARRPIESPAPSVIERKSINQPLQTGIKAIDALVPIGRGQRELIIGDKQTGKTAIAIDAIINQKKENVICIYVAIGQKASTVASVVQKLAEHGALDYTIIVAAPASMPAPLLYIAPYAGAAMGEYFMETGRDVLIVYDDLSKQAAAYRELSLLLKRPPGREAYPGDVFYLHSRLLERAAKLSDALGGGSMTALPIVETQAGDISAYIPTNVISITDGQIFLESDLFFAGNRPAINVGLSVSRVGGAAQIKAMKQVAGTMRIDLAQYRELAAFAQFGSDLDASTQKTLERGKRMTEILKQAQYAPLSVEEQIVSLFFAGSEHISHIPVSDIVKAEQDLLKLMHDFHQDMFEQIKEKGVLDEAMRSHLDTIIGDLIKFIND